MNADYPHCAVILGGRRRQVNDVTRHDTTREEPFAATESPDSPSENECGAHARLRRATRWRAEGRLHQGYSMRRAFMGEMEAARLAGIMAARNEHMVRAQVATVSAGGSHQERPYN
jgi:hypothetical protein